VIGFALVVYGHQYLEFFSKVDMREIKIMTTTRIVEILILCLYAVDLFLWIGGFFLGYIMLSQNRLNTF